MHEQEEENKWIIKGELTVGVARKNELYELKEHCEKNGFDFLYKRTSEGDFIEEYIFEIVSDNKENVEKLIPYLEKTLTKSRYD